MMIIMMTMSHPGSTRSCLTQFDWDAVPGPRTHMGGLEHAEECTYMRATALDNMSNTCCSIGKCVIACGLAIYHWRY
jgi:hypothetical protein